MAARGIPKIFVGNIPWTIGRKELREYFSQFGQIQNANVFFDKETGLSRNFGFVQFLTRDGYLNSGRENNHFLEGNRLTVTDVHATSGSRFPNQNTTFPSNQRRSSSISDKVAAINGNQSVTHGNQDGG